MHGTCTDCKAGTSSSNTRHWKQSRSKDRVAHGSERCRQCQCGKHEPKRRQRRCGRSNTTAVNAALKSKLIHYSGPSDKKKQAALTFDDGPDDRYTLQILDILKKYNVKATFFLIGQKAKAHPDVVKRIVQEGHAIGNHTWSHPDLDKIGTVKVMEEISKTQDELASIIGYRPTLFRPPYGAVNPADLQAISDMGLSIVNWSVDTRDWAGTPTQGILSAVHKELKPGDHTGALCRREEP